MKLLIDSTVWKYYVDATLKEHKQVAPYVNEILQNEEIYTTTIIVTEICSYLIDKLGAVIGAQKAEQFLLGPYECIDFQQEDLLQFISKQQLNAHLGLQRNEIMLLTCMDKMGISTIVTHTNKFRNIDGYQVIDPVKSNRH